MRPETEVRSAPPRLPDLDEDELELGRYWGALVRRWWLPLGGLVGGIVVGYLLSLGGNQVYQAQATIYLGQPLSSSGTPLPSLSTNPSAVRQVVLSPFFQHEAERAAGLPVGSLRGHVSIQSIAGAAPALGRTGQNPLDQIVVTGSRPARIAEAADALGRMAATQVSAGYVSTKIAYLKRQVAAQNAALASIDRTIAILKQGANATGLSTPERLIIASQLNAQTLQRSQVVDQAATYQNQLTLAQTVEASKLVVPASAVRTTARSRRNSVAVGGLIGLLLGIIAALLWEPLTRIVRRSRI